MTFMKQNAVLASITASLLQAQKIEPIFSAIEPFSVMKRQGVRKEGQVRTEPCCFSVWTRSCRRVTHFLFVCFCLLMELLRYFKLIQRGKVEIHRCVFITKSPRFPGESSVARAQALHAGAPGGTPAFAELCQEQELRAVTTPPPNLLSFL